jgi:hypothetical protein
VNNKKLLFVFNKVIETIFEPVSGKMDSNSKYYALLLGVATRKSRRRHKGRDEDMGQVYRPSDIPVNDRVVV